MLVCHCHAVSDRKVLEVLREGARTTEDVGRACGAGTRCGGCRHALEELVAAALTCECGAPDCPGEHSRRSA